MKKIFLYAIMSFAFFQIKSSQNMAQESACQPPFQNIYNQIEANDFNKANHVLSKCFNILNVRELTALNQILESKRTLLEQELKNSSAIGYYTKKIFKTLTSTINTTASSVICASFIVAALYHSNVKEELNGGIRYLENCWAKTPGKLHNFIQYLKNKQYQFNDKTVCYGALTCAALSMIAVGLNAKNLANTIWTNKRTETKKLIKEIQKLELNIKNRLLILNQKEQ